MRLFGGGDGNGGLDSLKQRRSGKQEPRKGLKLPRRRFRARRILLYLAAAVFGWVALSLVLFLVSAQFERESMPSTTKDALTSGGFLLTTPNTVLVLGSDARTKSTAEPGSKVGGPSRSDAIMLLRIGGGKSARLSIPRDTVAYIPGHGSDKINAAYAYGGPALAVRTVENFLGIKIHHVIDLNFGNFPSLIDALGGIDYESGCVRSLINGGSRNGGFTLNLKPGKHHLNGKQALALARTRKNRCDPKETDLTRQMRQQQILSAVQHRILSPSTFFRLPWVAWNAPKAVRSDMDGFSLLSLATAMTTTKAPPVEILRPSSDVVLPNGGQALVVSESEKRRARQRFLEAD